MKDIEDCAPGNGASGEHTDRVTVNPRVRGDVEKHGADVPGDASVFVHTFGCGHNVSDGEYMAGLLVDGGYRVTDAFQNADCYLINSCTVKNPSEEHFVTMLRRAKATGKPVVVAGCVPSGEPDGAEWSDVSVVGVRSIGWVRTVVEESLRGHVVRLVDPPQDRERTPAGGIPRVSHRSSNSQPSVDARSPLPTSHSLPQLSLPKIRRNQFIEIIPINVGCLNNCTYCKTKHARGDLQSWPVDEIIRRVVQVVREGVREIRLTSEDVGAYGIDIGTNIVDLLRGICAVLEGTDVMLRVGMSNPPYLLRHVQAFAALLLHPNIYEFVHIPVQSGSNAILDSMKREYTVEDFLECVAGIRHVVPAVTVATDIICAFPGEGESEWNETMDLCRAVQFPVLNISRYYARRGTPAAAWPQVRTDVAKRRTVEITEYFNSYTTYESLVGTEHWITLLEVAHDKRHLVGHTKAYVQVLVDPGEADLGDHVLVVVAQATKYSVTGRVKGRRPFRSSVEGQSDVRAALGNVKAESNTKWWAKAAISRGHIVVSVVVVCCALAVAIRRVRSSS